LHVPTATDKERALEAIRTLPDGATIDEAIERLCLIAKIEEGLRQSKAGQVVSHEEIKKRFLA
jgi:predicted transcriptional regulator